jgi:hypothetical protein
MFRYSPTSPRELKPASLQRAEYLEKVTEKIAADLGASSYILAGSLGIVYLLKVYERELPRILASDGGELENAGITDQVSFLKEVFPPRITQVTKGFYRDIRSVRLLCLEDALENIAKNGEQKGLQLCNRKRMSGRIEQYVPISPEEAIKLSTEKHPGFLASTHIRLIRLENGRVPNHLKEEIGRYYDVFLHHYQNSTGERVRKVGLEFIDRRGNKADPEEIFVASNKHRFSVPLKYFHTLQYSLPKGRVLSIANPVYMYVETKKHFEKTNDKDEIDFIDLEILDNLIKFATGSTTKDLLSPRQ